MLAAEHAAVESFESSGSELIDGAAGTSASAGGTAQEKLESLECAIGVPSSSFETEPGVKGAAAIGVPSSSLEKGVSEFMAKGTDREKEVNEEKAFGTETSTKGLQGPHPEGPNLNPNPNPNPNHKPNRDRNPNPAGYASSRMPPQLLYL